MGNDDDDDAEEGNDVDDDDDDDEGAEDGNDDDDDEDTEEEVGDVNFSNHACISSNSIIVGARSTDMRAVYVCPRNASYC